MLSKDDYKRRMCIEDYTETSFDIKDNESIFNTVVNCQSLNELKKMVVQKEKKNKVLQEDIMRLYFSVGKRKKIAAGNLVGAICALEDVNGDDIGIIQVQDMCSYVDILNDLHQMFLSVNDLIYDLVSLQQHVFFVLNLVFERCV